MIGWLVSLINPVKAVAKELIKWKVKQANAETEQARIEADVQIHALEAKRDLLLSEQSHVITRNMRPLFTIPFIAYVWKVVGWDKVVKGNWGEGVTDPLSTNMWTVFIIIISAYFSFRGAEKVISYFRRK